MHPDHAPSTYNDRDIATAIRAAARLVSLNQTLTPYPTRAIALHALSQAVFNNQGRITGLSAENFRRAHGTNLYRGLSDFRHIAENLNGYWVGTGFMTDGNHYAGETAKYEAIEDFGFSRTWGWAMIYKLRPDARMTELAPIESMPLQQFIAEVRRLHDADPCDLQAIHQDRRQVGLHAVLLNYDVMVNSDEDHYVVYNNDTLVYSEAFTPQAFGLPEPTTSGSPDVHNAPVSRLQRASPIDNDNQLAIKYQSARDKVRMLFAGGTS